MFVRDRQPVSLRSLGGEGRRADQRQKHHGSDDAGRRPGLETARFAAKGRMPTRRWQSIEELIQTKFNEDYESRRFPLGYSVTGMKRRSRPRRREAMSGRRVSPGHRPRPRFMSSRSRATTSSLPGSNPANSRTRSARFETALIQTRAQILEMQERIAEVDRGEGRRHFRCAPARGGGPDVDRRSPAQARGRSLQRGIRFSGSGDALRDTLSQIDDPYLRERALDIQDVTRRVIRNLQGKAPKPFPRR